MRFDTPRIRNAAQDHAALLVLGSFSVVLLYLYRPYLTTAFYPSVDLTSHIALAERLLYHALNGQLFFYDTAEFTGWPAFQFYGFAGHLATAVFGALLSPFFDEPVRVAVQWVAIVGVAALPASLYFAALPFVEDLMGAPPARRDRSRPLLAFAVGTLAVWFLSLGEAWFGIGAGAIFHFGLYAQLFGWHLMLAYLGLLVRAVRGDAPQRPLVGLTAVFALLLVTHPLSAAFCGGIGALAVVYFDRRRVRLGVAHALAIGLTGFWLIPFFAMSARFTLSGVTPVSYDLWQLLVRYPLGFLAHWLAELLAGRLLPLNPTHVVLGCLVILSLCHRRVRATALVAPFLVLFLLLAALVPSTFVVSSIPLGLHYQRLLGFLTLVALAPLAAVPFALVARDHDRPRTLMAIGAVFAVCLVATIAMPDPRHAVVSKAMASPDFLTEETEVVRYFLAQQPPGRVLFEWFDEPGRYPPLCERYIQAQLVRYTPFETANGLLVQSAPAYRYTVLTSLMLGARTTAGHQQPGGGLFRPGMSDFPLLVEWRISRSREPNLARLRALGVTHVVAGSQAFLDSVLPAATGGVVSVGKYSIVRIGDWAPATAVEGAVIGYVDLKGNLPFSFVELFVYSNGESVPRPELLLLEPGKPIPPQVSLVLVNGDPQRDGPRTFFEGRRLDELLADRRRIDLDYEQAPPSGALISPVRYRPDEEAFRHAERYLSGQLGGLPLTDLPESAPRSFAPNPTLTWESQQQAFSLTGLAPRRLVRLAYSFFPYWRSPDGDFYRGTAERMFFLPRGTAARASYSRGSRPSTWIGWAVTLMSVVTFWLGSGAPGLSRLRDRTTRAPA